MSVEAAFEFLQDLRSAIPVVWWKVQCYHYVRKTRQVTRYRNGDAFTTMQVYYERINSQTRSAAFNWSHCGARDASKTLIGLENFFATRIKFTKGFSFCSIDSEVEFDMQRSSFFHAQERNDDYMETREGLDLLHVPFKSNLMVYSSRTPWYISQCVYWIFSFILLSWPLRILIEYNTAYVHYHILKVFGCSSTPHLSREATMCSSDLEHLVQRNYDIVPSYSEALLIDNSTNQHRHVARMHNPADALVLQNPHALLTSSVSVPNGILFDYGSMKGRKKSLKNCSGKSNNSLTTPASGSDCQMPPGYEEALNMRLINDYATPTSNSTNSLGVFETEL
ncbi:unnamed protein product [Dimorphilus gyrociliatus]|uniref:Uncharacterized protein n=1 Tax=Dimorphilus gyrociliatus TaxID=2664684 RepID=A0A7I8VVA8_9ANNE|nr:unnamed protein product [Dimorphilus gyrociliatus]